MRLNDLIDEIGAAVARFVYYFVILGLAAAILGAVLKQ